MLFRDDLPDEVDNYLARGYSRINSALRNSSITREVGVIDEFIYDQGVNMREETFYRSLSPAELDLSVQHGYMSVSDSTDAAIFSVKGRVTVRVYVNDDILGIDVPEYRPERSTEGEVLLERGLHTVYHPRINTLVLTLSGNNGLL